MSKWPITSLKGKINIKHGFPFKSEYFSDEATQFIVLTPGNFYEEGGFKRQAGKEKFYTGDIPEEYLHKAGDLIVAMTEQAAGLLGSCARVPESGIYLHNQRLGLVTTDSKKILRDYIYHLFKTKTVREQIRLTSSGSKVKHTSPERIYDVRVPLPTVSEQQNIVALLDALETKIELNNRINAELEAMAKTLYDYWFVQFDFPDDSPQGQGKPYKTSGGKMVYNPTLKREIPEGWEPVSVGKIVDIKTGKEDANYATERGKYHFFTCGESALRCDDFVFEGKAVLLAGNGSFSVKRYEGKFNAYQRTYVLIPKQDELYAPLYFAVNDKVKTLTSGSRGSIVKFITKGDIEDIYLPLPTNRKLEFVKTLNVCFKESSRLYEQNLELVSLRDWLLPMLMNGQVTVGEAS
ncbi:TPA: restriction endonuclease subunit S [Vibrio parahaemolyticus]|nr:restriction endonuclease subunit S [Vibrio parahaemolyticus]